MAQRSAPVASERDDPDLGADPARNNDFGYRDDVCDLKRPAGAHARRANPRDASDHEMSANIRLHRMIRRGTSYGPPLPDGVLVDDGADRGIMFVFVGTYQAPWSGTGPITQVHLSLTGEGDCYPATLEPPKGPYQWQDWSFDWPADAPGRHTLRARAADAADVQPWNRLGYGNNAIEVSYVDVR
jgi:hypothetical protein